ncbi:MAG TPA: cupin domain-containing protein [Bordetella sp.]|nr:cupin domain-containing protein [Bordetella sp.]
MSTIKQLKTVPVSMAQMLENVARFRELRPQSSYYRDDQGIPHEAYETVTAKALYTLMAPSVTAGPMSATPAILTEDNLSVIIAECPPGDKPMLHAHFFTVEHFFCLSGQFKVRWGDNGENQLTLDPFDMIRVPPGVCRDFTNVTDQTAHLLVFITGKGESDYNDIGFAPGESQKFKQRFGEDVAEKLETIGFSFLK